MAARSNIIKDVLKRLYQRSSPQLQAANRVARTIAPKSKIAGAIAALATPSILNSEPSKKATGKKKTGAGKVAQKRGTTERTHNTKPTAKRIKGNAARRGTYTSRKRTGEGDQGSYSNIMPTMGMPGDDMSTIARRPNRVKRMKGGGLAIKGQGKAFLKSKR
jgi:hypothetical protein|tara:strand:+ start:14 stop:499 length:486 start_codon:yes stop_codon:yes gene_type:complete